MRRILLVLTVALIMSLVVAGQAWADPTKNAHNCAGEFASADSPETINRGQWGDTAKKAAQKQEGDELAMVGADQGNCGVQGNPEE